MRYLVCASHFVNAVFYSVREQGVLVELTCQVEGRSHSKSATLVAVCAAAAAAVFRVFCVCTYVAFRGQENLSFTVYDGVYHPRRCITPTPPEYTTRLMKKSKHQHINTTYHRGTWYTTHPAVSCLIITMTPPRHHLGHAVM